MTTRALIIDSPEVKNLGQELTRILQSISTAKLILLNETLDATKVELSGNQRLHSHWHPDLDLVFIVTGGERCRRGSEWLEYTLAGFKHVPIFLVTDDLDPDEMIRLLKLGVVDFIAAPLKAINVLPRIWRFIENPPHEDVATQSLKERLGLQEFIGVNAAFVAEIQKIPRFAKCDANVFISGETGTGKEMCARALHYLGRRAAKPFVPVNCGAIPLELVENELFGHARGAYTGATDARAGLVFEADGGTLFLDEIDCLPQLAQVKLLRFLQDKAYRPLGSPRVRGVDVRLMAASNLDAEAAVRAGALRRDLYYRLKVLTLRLPALSERREDVPLLARHFLKKYAAEFNKPVADFTPEALQALTLYDWPGNVRELEHVVERAVVLCDQPLIGKTFVDLTGGDAPAQPEAFRQIKARVVAQFERAYIQSLLVAHRGNITQAAQAAQKNRRAFFQLMRKHRIDGRSFAAGTPPPRVDKSLRAMD
ncbi:MAG TPA: sigma-54 dependent transcriptional regulator [Verrucomicrobiae bacterium]|nr:sigma-54 dependent transcriptional regulator [Verrucomicrobiae bacterium]